MASVSVVQMITMSLKALVTPKLPTVWLTIRMVNVKIVNLDSLQATVSVLLTIQIAHQPITLEIAFNAMADSVFIKENVTPQLHFATPI
jgi:hypothetical protein